MARITMPKMGDSMEEGTLLRWIKHEGDTVAADDVIAEIETDKASVEIQAEQAGTISKILVKEGQTVPVGAVIALLGEEEATTSEPQANGAAAVPVEPAGPETPPAFQSRSGSPGPSEERLKASPLARNMAEQHGIDLAQVKGTGPGGRIVERDIKAFLQQSQTGGGLPALPNMPEPARRSTRQPTAPAISAPGRDTPLSKMRKAIARVTVTSKQTVPHFYIVMPIDMDTAIGMLDQLNTGTAETKITINDIIVKASATALTHIPQANVSYMADDTVRQYDDVNIGIAVVTDQGLMIPVINNCGGKTLRQISSDARGLIAKARGGTLTPRDMSGGTFSVSNLGMFGVEEFAAIINPPESAILAVGAALPEVTPGPDGAFIVRKRMRVTLSCDHRTVDGVLGARLLQEIKRLLENPYELLA